MYNPATKHATYTSGVSMPSGAAGVVGRGRERGDFVARVASVLRTEEVMGKGRIWLVDMVGVVCLGRW